MSEFDVIIDEYPGDTRWQEYVDVFRSGWYARTGTEKERYRSTFGDEEIAIALTGNMGDQAVDWFATPWGVLQQRTALEIIKNERHGLQIIKSVLMRMH